MAVRLIVGCGYLGQRVAALWQKDSSPLYATTRSSSFALPGVQPILCDVLNPPQLPEVDTVLYAVGFDRSSGASMRSVYVDGLAKVLARLPRPQRFIYVSSSSVYGQSGGEWGR